MGTFVAAYVIAWAAITGYVLWMGAGQRRLARAVRALQLQLESTEDEERSAAKAA